MAIIDLSGVIESFSVDFEVVRRGQGTMSAGRYYKSDEVTRFPARGSIQPLSGEEIRRLPELERTEERVTVYTQCDLDPGKSLNGVPDRICYENATYEVETKRNWNTVGGYYAYMCVRVDN